MAKRKKYLVDTSVLISLLRGNENAKFALETISKDDIYICDITVLEILVGCHTVEKRERALDFLNVFEHINNCEKVSKKAIQLMMRYCVRREQQPELQLADCLIASFAVVHKMPLLTFNKKDFDFIQGIDIHSLSH